MPQPTRFGSTLSRRRALTLAGTGIAGLGAAALIGCSSSGNDGGAPTGGGAGVVATQGGGAASAKPKRGGILKYPERMSPDTLDPYRSGGGLPHNASLVYSRLFDFEPGDGNPASGKIIGNLAETWENPDPLTLVLHLNKAAKFDDKDPLNGRTVTAEDVVQSWARYAKEDTYRTRLANSANPDAPIVSMEAVDASTVRVKYKFVDVTALPNFVGGFWVMPVEGIAGKIDLAKTPRGSGPFLFENYQNAVSFSYKRNPNWFLGGGERPYVDGLQIPIVSDQAQLEVQFRTKNLHFKAVSPTNLPQFAKELDGTEVAVGGPQGASPTLVFSYSPNQPWHDVRVRRAVSMAIDRDLMADVLFDPQQFKALGVDLNIRWNVPISGGYGAYWLDPKSSDFGPAAQYLQPNTPEAVKLLAAAGFSSTKPLEFDNVYPGTQWGTNWPQRVEIMQSMVQKAGIKMNAASVDYVTDYTPNYMRAKAAFKGKTTEAAVHFMPGSSGASPHPLIYYSQFLSSNGSSSMVGKKYPELDEMRIKLLGVTNFEEQRAGIHNLNRWMTDNMAVWPVGPDIEQVDLVWKALRGPQQFTTWGGGGRSPDLVLLDLYWFDGQV